MEYAHDLESGSSPRIRQAAKAIAKERLKGYGPSLLTALTKEIEKPAAWKTQCQLIEAIAITECVDALAKLKQLLDRDYQSTILYRALGFAVFLLENVDELNLDSLYHSIQKRNQLQISGACSGLLYKKSIPPNEDIRRIIAGIAPYTENEGPTLTPRCYIAAVAYQWPIDETREFLESCKASPWNGLVEIAESSLQGKESKYQLV